MTTLKLVKTDQKGEDELRDELRKVIEQARQQLERTAALNARLDQVIARTEAILREAANAAGT